MEYRIEKIGEVELQDRMNVIAAEGWKLVACMIHGLQTDEGRPLFVTVWEK